jgi:NAD(P)-dependent dehydrogenase (short-subunit alcohol dehydrogenase family)
MTLNERLKGKTILITGSSRGIGAATARLAKDYGADVILHGKSESRNLTTLAYELESKYIFCNVSDEHDVCKKVKELGKIDILVNNAGINISKPFLDYIPQDWQQIFETNILGPVNFSKAVIPEMQKNKYGRIVNVASIKGYTTLQGSTAYAASKAALINLTSNLAGEFAKYGILVNGVSPGFTKTEMTDSTLSERVKVQINKIPLKRMAETEEIAKAILHMASEDSSYITGQTIIIDGGLSVS